MDYSSKIEFIIAVGTLSMLVLVTFIILFLILYQKKRIRHEMTLQKAEAEYKHELLVSTIDIQESERKQIAFELHDNIGTLLSTVRLKVYSLNKNNTEVTNQDSYREALNMIDDIIGTTRTFSRELMSPTLENFGLAISLENLCSQFHSEGVLNVDFHMEGEYKRLGNKTELSIFRIAQEILNNIFKHAQASEIHMVLICCDQLELQIADNGNGFFPNAIKFHTDGVTNPGLGLKSIETRLHLLKADIQYNPNLMKGTKVIIRIPEQEA